MSATAPGREEQIRALLPFVRRIARRIKRLVPGFDLDDLVGDGSLGLIRAVDSFDPSRGPTLQQYARRLVIGTMLNGIRRMDPVSERARRTVRDGENERYAMAVARGEVPSAAEVELRCPGYLRAMSATHRGQPLSLDAPLPLGETLSGDWSADPGRIVEERTRRRDLVALVARLPQRQRDIVVAHYYRGSSLRAIGKAMAISPQRASQLHLAAIAKLQAGTHASPD
ncbi:MAG: sigma-70 family RNA polymerase sigma factor [Candidatus Tumulicola sp.]